MPTTNSPNMNLPIPGVGSEPGPDYASDINNSLTIIDQHDHSNGSGVPVTPSGLNINTDLTLNNNSLTNIEALTLTAQSSLSTLLSIYAINNDLYFNDGLGNAVRITQSGGIAGSPGSIANLTSPASATYVSASQTFVWQSDTGIAANMDAGSLLLRNLSPNSNFALTLQPPAALSSNYSITLPTLPPTNNRFMQLDSSGTITALYILDQVTITTAANQMQVKDGGISTAKLADSSVTTSKIADANVTTAKIADSNVTTAKIASSAVTTAKIANANVSLAKLTGIPQYIAASTSVVITPQRTAGSAFLITLGQISVGSTANIAVVGSSLVIGLSSSVTGPIYNQTITPSATMPLSTINYVYYVGASSTPQTITLTLTAFGPGASASLVNCSLVAYEL